MDFDIFVSQYKQIQNDFFVTDSIPKETNAFLYHLKYLFSDLIINLTVENPQFFPNLYSRILFLFNQLKFDEKELRKMLFFQKILFTKKERNLSREDCAFLLKTMGDILKLFVKIEFEINIPKDLYSKSNIYDKFLTYVSIPIGRDSFYQVIITRIYKEKSAILCSDGTIQIYVLCHKWWAEIPKLGWVGLLLNIFNLHRIDENTFETTAESLIVVEPDYLFDISEIASAYSKNGFNAYLYIYNKLILPSFSFNTFLGNVINSLFDELVFDNDKPLDEILQISINRRILEFLVLKDRNPNVLEELYSISSNHYYTIIQSLPFFQQFEIQVEPSFFSAELGLQGRMDMLLEDKNQHNNKYIVELKSGNFPDYPVEFRVSKDVAFYTPLWHSHYAQTIGYNLLAQSVWETRKGSSMVLYSKDKLTPLREAVNNDLARREFIRSRNWAFFFENAIVNKRFKIFFTDISKFINESSFQSKAISDFKSALQDIAPIYQKLFLHFISFILKESKLAKVSGSFFSDSKYSQFNLWSLTLEEKIINQVVLNDLTLSIERSNFNSFYLTFYKTEMTTSITSIRKGDPVILYHTAFFRNPLSGQVFKGVIKSIDDQTVTISLRNKLTSHTFFNRTEGWIIEPDVIESSTRNLLNSIVKFVYLNPERIEYLLAEKFPYRKDYVNFFFTEIDENYSKILMDAVSFYPFYIIKGPPGTGKTRIVINKLIEYYYNNTDYNLLVLAFTNRAVDEVAEVLTINGLGDKFLRIGTKESSDFSENLVANLSGKYSINEIESKIKNCRIFLSTVFSALTNPALFYLKKFQIGIVDEASQILFPHLIGILAEVEKFILIGDEKQLPAIVLQEDSKIDDDELKELGFDDFQMSYFEFLIRKLNKNGVSECVSLLDIQSRMHPSILELINTIFYGNKIRTFLRVNNNFKLEELLEIFLNKIGISSNSRVVFIDSPIESYKKVNQIQAKITSKLIDYFIEMYGDGFKPEFVGVVSPYRLQNAEIIKRLSPKAKKLIVVDTVERFQGSERNIIFLSLPFNNLYQIRFSQSISMFEDNSIVDRKLNVALSRAKDLLIILANKELLLKNSIYRRLVNILDQKRLIVDYISISSTFNIVL